MLQFRFGSIPTVLRFKRLPLDLTMALALCAGWVHSLAADEWRDYRGPTGQGHAAAHDLPTVWSETNNVTWKTALPGKGWSTPVVDNNQVWCTTAVEEPLSKEEQEKRLTGLPNSNLLATCGSLELMAIGLDRATGKENFRILLHKVDKPYPVHGMNSYASPSPLLVGNNLICHFGSHGTYAVDTTTGKIVWSNDELQINHENGAGSTPVAYKNLVIVHFDGSDFQYLAALDAVTGKVVWKTDRSGKMSNEVQEKKSYGTPLVTQVDGQDVLLSPAADWLYAYEPATGKELWKLNYEVLGYSVVPRPVVGEGMLFMCTSFNTSDVLGITFNAQGAQIAWRRARKGSKIPSPLLVDNNLYITGDDGVIDCLDPKSGDVRWTKRVGGEHCSSPIFADGKLYFCNREGETHVVEPGDTFKVLSKNTLAGQHMASPVAVDKELYFRTDSAVYRIEQE